MEVLPDFVQVVVEDLVRSVLAASGLRLSANFAQDTVEFVLCENVWDPAARQDVVDIDEELLFCDLCVRKNEEKLDALDA